DITGKINGAYNARLKASAATGNDTWRISGTDSCGLDDVILTDNGGNNLLAFSGGTNGVFSSALSIGAGHDTYRISGGTGSGISGDRLMDSGGNNLFEIRGGVYGVESSTLSIGAGHDTYRISGGTGSGISGGKLTDNGGNNLFVIHGKTNGATQSILTASAATGNDTWRITGEDSCGFRGLMHGVENRGTLEDMGGNNLFVIHGKRFGAEQSTLSSGAGNDTWRITGTDASTGKGLSGVSLTDTGGSNLFVIRGGYNAGNSIIESTLNLAGNNTLNVVASGTAVGRSTLTLGGGKDVLEISAGSYALDSVTLNDAGGDNILTVYGGTSALRNNTSITLGGGKDLVTLASRTGPVMLQSVLNTGDGADSVFLEGLKNDDAMFNSSLFTGAGNDLVSVRGMLNNSRMETGDGADVIRLHSGATLLNGAVINGGAGMDSLDLSLMECANLYTILAGGTLRDVEVIDLSKNGGTALRVTVEDLTKITFSGEDTVPRVNGEAADTVYLVGSGSWTKGATSGGYTTYTNGVKSIQIKTGVKVSFENAAFNALNYSETLSVSDVYTYTAKQLTGDASLTSDKWIKAGSSFTFGNGNNTVSFTSVVGDGYTDTFTAAPTAVTIKTGNGDNAVTLGKSDLKAHAATNLALTTGAGNDTITLRAELGYAAMRGGCISAGNGWNSISITGRVESLYNAANTKVFSRAQIKTGTGNDSIYIYDVTGADVIDTGGNNTLVIGALSGVMSGAGTAMLSKALVQTGAGHDSITVVGVQGATVDAGNGRNTVTIEGDVTSLYGTGRKDAPVVLAKGQIKTGSGDDSITLQDRLVGADITDTGGQNTVSIAVISGTQAAVLGYNMGKGVYQVASITLGNGDDSLSISNNSTAGVGAGVLGGNIKDAGGHNTISISAKGTAFAAQSYLSGTAEKFAGGQITLGAGHDNVSITSTGNVAAMNAVLSLGAGNNTLSLSGKTVGLQGSGGSAAKVTAGAGNDSLEITGSDSIGAYGANINLGAGRNVVEITGGMLGLAGREAYTFNVEGILQAEIATDLITGAGDDDITITSTKPGGVGLYMASVNAGAGNNSITISGDLIAFEGALKLNTAGDAALPDRTGFLQFQNALTMGAGHDTVTLSSKNGHGLWYAALDLGAGNNVLEITAKTSSGYSGAIFSSIHAGAGADVITIKGSSSLTYSRLKDDGGNNVLTLEGAMDNSTIALGAGHDSLTLTAQAGNSFAMSSSAHTDTGGHNTISITGGTSGAVRNSTLRLGAGNDSVEIAGNVHESDGLFTSISLGAGNDFLGITGNVVAERRGTVSIDLGAGNDSMEITGNVVANFNGVTSISLGAGNDFLGVTGNVTGRDGAGLTINLGDGVNTLDVSGYVSTSTVSLGKNNDSVLIGSAGAATSYEYATGYTEIKDTGGHNAITITGGTKGAMLHSTLTLGAGNDAVDIAGNVTGAGGPGVKITLGDGVNTLNVSGYASTSTISLGKHSDSVRIGSAEASASYEYATGYTEIKDTGGHNTITITGGTGGAMRNSTLTLGTGNDVVDITGNVVATGFNKTTINLGAGNDFLSVAGNISAITNGTVAMNLGAGDDTMQITGGIGAGTRAHFSLDLGAGNDSLSVGGDVSASFYDDVFIDLGAGNDTLSIAGNVSAIEYSVTTIALGAGNDSLSIAGKVSAGDSCTVIIDLDAGNDTLSIGGNVSAEKGGELTIALGAGNDSLSIAGGITVGPYSEATIDLGAGNDFLSIGGNVSVSDDSKVTIDLGEGHNTLAIQGSVRTESTSTLTVAALAIALGAGNDSVTVDHTGAWYAMQDVIFTDTGGNNYVSITGTSGGDSVLHSNMTFGKGDDTLEITGGVMTSTINLGEGSNFLRIN
ncbi:hypothetical protein LJC26_08125, partial [Desulfovibrio sp. OttesenSCG-928-O18]|nr:hypothetical protein [Desulfovibrio sp. OttesenSCG-928-O18]